MRAETIEVEKQKRQLLEEFLRAIKAQKLSVPVPTTCDTRCWQARLWTLQARAPLSSPLSAPIALTYCKYQVNFPSKAARPLGCKTRKLLTLGHSRLSAVGELPLPSCDFHPNSTQEL